MLLTSLTIENFRCIERLSEIPVHRLAVFIGSNGAGKTAILKALEILFTTSEPEPSDYFRQGDVHVDSIRIEGNFELEAHDTLPEAYHTPDGKGVLLIKTFTKGKLKCEVQGLAIKDARLRNFAVLKAPDQKAALKSIGLSPENLVEDRMRQLEAEVASGRLERVPATFEVDFAPLMEHLPRFEMIASSDFRKPDEMVRRTLQDVVRATIYPMDAASGVGALRADLKAVEAEVKAELVSKVREMEDEIRVALPKLRRVSVEPQVDFARSVSSTPLLLDVGDGLDRVERLGDGDQKKLWMALLEWQQKAARAGAPGSVFRTYDEPDVNLDYDAERKLFSTVLEATDRKGTKTQAVVCTHAVSMIDRAAAESLNLISVDSTGKRSVGYLRGADDADLADFLREVGRAMGVTNSTLFYERAFIVVEGESEEGALPILYRTIYGKRMVEDGIAILPLGGSNGWHPILKILQKNRSEITTMLLDADCKSPTTGLKITPTQLSAIGFPLNFVTNQCFFIGTKEFEDAFATADILAAMNTHFPRIDGSPWAANDVDQWRTAPKFSKSLVEHIGRYHDAGGKPIKKPVFARRLAEVCTTHTQVPQAVRDLFVVARRMSKAEVPPPPLLTAPAPPAA